MSATPTTPERPPCTPPADFRAEIAAYDQAARVGTWASPRYRMTYRVHGQGPPLLLVPGIAATYRGYSLLLNRLAEHFTTITYDYPGENRGDGARLRRIKHGDLVDDGLGLLDHLGHAQCALLGISFGSTVALAALHRAPERFPKAAVQGGFAYRPFAPAERLALMFGRWVPGTTANLPFRDRILSWNNKAEFPGVLPDRWEYYLEENALTSIAGLAHRCDQVARLDLRPLLPEIRTPVLLIQGHEDRIIARKHYDELMEKLPNARGTVLPLVGHQVHYTHPELMARLVSEFFLDS
jgi:pimeloyl-ACP methyl ester carboxylesterase